MKTISILIILAFFSQKGTNAQTAEDIFKNSIAAIDFESMEMTATLKIADAKGSERIRQIASANKKFGETSKMIMKFVSPPEIKGIAMLIYDYNSRSDDMWIYMPALRKIRRIVSNEKGKSFMGSEFSNADMSKPNMSDFNYNLLGTTVLNSKNCWEIESVCKNESISDENGFKRKVSYIQQDTYLCQKVEIYDHNNRLIKTQLLNQYKKQPNGKFFAFNMEMKNEQNGRNSILTIDKFQMGSSLQESNFTPAMLEK